MLEEEEGLSRVLEEDFLVPKGARKKINELFVEGGRRKKEKETADDS